MAQYDSNSYPLVTKVAPNDRVLFMQDSEGRLVRATAQTFADYFASNGDQLVVSGLRAKDVSALSTGSVSILGGYYTLGDGGGGQFYYDSASTATDNGGTVIEPDSGVGRWLRPESNSFNIREFGAVGDGSHDDTSAIQGAVDSVVLLGLGTVVVPAGNYKISGPITLASAPANNLSIIGEGPNVSIITQSAAGANGFTFNFANVGVQQPYRLTVTGIGLQATVSAGTGIKVSYGIPASTSTHYTEGTLIDNVAVASSDAGSWNTGLDIESGWNCKITNNTFSGNPFGGTWTSLIGSGIRLRRSCVNTHISDCQANFFFTGLYYSAEGSTAGDPNTEGLFCFNNSFIAVRHGVWLQGNSSATSPWLTGFQWIGGIIELRAAISCIQLEACSEARISNTFMLEDSASGTSIGVYAGTCQDVIISGNQFYGLGFGVKTVGVCDQFIVSNNHFKGGGDQVYFADGAINCRSSLNLVNTAETYIAEYNLSTDISSNNRVLQGNAFSFFAKKNAAQSIPDSTDTAITWQTTVYDDVVQALLILDPATPSRIYVPKGVSRVKLTVGVRWDTSATGNRSIKIRTPVAGSYYPANANWASDSRTAVTLSDCTVSTGVINLDPVVGFHTTYFDVVVNQTSGGALDVRNVEGTFIHMEILG